MIHPKIVNREYLADNAFIIIAWNKWSNHWIFGGYAHNSKIQRFSLRILNGILKKFFEIKFIRKTILQHITIQVWDGQVNNMRGIDQSEAFRYAKYLKLEDKNLCEWHPDIRGFTVIWRWQVTMQVLYRIREELATILTPNRHLTIISHCSFNRDDFITALGADYYGVVECTPRRNPRDFVIVITAFSGNEVVFDVRQEAQSML